MTNDLIQRCIEQICEHDKERGLHTFTAAQLSNRLMEVSRLSGVIDGQLIRTILTGRRNIIVLGSGYYGVML